MSLPATRAAPAPGAAAPRARPTPRAPRPAASSRGRSRATMVRAGRGVSPLSGEAYDASSRSHLHDDDDEVVTSLWLPTRDLGVGDAGTDVGMLQEAFGLPATGVFDKATAREIARWQGACGLPKSGYFGAASRERFANDAAAGLFRREPRVRARDARALAPSTSARTHGAAEDDIAQRRFIGVDSYPYPSPSPAAPGSGASATASGSGAVAGAGAAVVLGLAGAALARRALPDVFGGDGSRGSNRRGESPFDRLERLDRVDAAEAADAEEDARRERARRFRDADAAGVAGRAVAASRSRKKYPLAPPNRAKLSSKSPFGHEPATAEKDAIASSAKAAKSSTGGSSVRTPPRAAQTSPRPATPSPSTTRPSSSGSSSSFSVPRPRDANSISSEGGTPAGSWTGRPQSFDELRGFTPKRASPVDEIAEVNRRAPGGGGRFVDERLKRTRRTTGADDADAADADARRFDPRRSRRGDFSSFGGTVREEHDAHRDADEDEGGDGNENQTRGSKEKDDTKRRETEDDESGGIGGALMRAFGLDRRKAEFIERQKSKAAAAAKEKRDEADERKETDEKTENADDEEKEEKREKAKTAEEGSDSDADAASSTASSPFSPEASSQMSYLERLKLEEAERVARVAEDKARRDAAKANAENRARIDAEKEALREERARLIREQTEREERRRAREEKKRAEVLEVAEGAEGAVEAEQARETEAPETPETPGTDAESGSDFAARVRAASMLAEKSRAAGRVLSDENAAAERVKEKEMSFEERVAAARAQAANSGVADQMKAMFSRTDGDERAEDAGKPEKSAEDAEGSEDEAEGSEETDEGSEDADPSPVPETDAALTERVRSDAEETSAARTEPDAPEPPELPEVASSPSDASVSDASLRALSDDMDAISDDDFHRRVAEAARAVDFAESVLSDASDSEAAAETEALEAEMAAKALEAALAEKEAAAKKAALRAKAARDDLAAQMAAQMRAAAEAEAEWERAMRDAADVADARRKEDEAHFDPDGWAERAQRDLDEAMQVFERAEKWDANEDDDEAKDEAVAEAEDEDDAGRSESVDAEGRRADPEPAAEESPAMTPEERRAALVRALRGVDTGVIMRGAKTDEKAPDEKAPEEKAPEETAEDNSPEAKAASAEAENDSNKSNESNETDVSTAKDDSDAPSESQSSSPPKTTRKKGRFAAMLDEGAVEADYETSIRGTPPPPSKPSAAAEKTTSDPPEEEDDDDSYLLELDDDDYCAPDDEVCMWGLESKESLARALRGVNTSAIMTATETRGDDSNPEPEAEAPETDAREVEATPEAAPEPEPEAAPEPEPEPEPELDRAPEDSAAAPSPPEPKKEKKKGRFAAMLDEGAVEADYETSIRGTPPPAQKPAEEQEPAAADPEANSEPEETEPETAPEAEVPSAAPEVEEVKAEVDAPPAPPATKKGADWDEDKRSFAERVAAARAATQASASPQAPSKGPEPTPRAEPEPVPETAEPESESEPAAESAPFASPSSPESTMTAEERGAALARALRGLDTGAIMRAPVSEPEPEPEAEGIVADASDEVSAAPPAADEPKSEEDQKAKPKKKGRFAAMLDEGAVEADYATSIRGTPPPASESAEETPALEPTETVAKTKEEPKAEPAEAEPAEAEPAEAEAKLEVSAEPEPEPDAFATVDARPGYSMPIPRPAAPPGWWDTHEWPPAPSSEKTVAEATVEAEAETTVEPERDVEPENVPSPEPENVPSPEPENVPSPEPSAPSPSPMNGHELRTPAPGASDAFFAARISAARDDIRAIHDELREELDDDADSGSSSNRPFVDPESESNDAFDAKVRRAIADAAMDADPTMMRDSDALDRARYAAMLQERARAAEGSARGADVDAESDSFALQPGDHQLRTPRDPTVAERSAFGPEYAYASVGRDGIAAGWRWRGMESSSAPTTDVDDWASETRRRLVPPARGAFMGAPASALQPNLASLADDAAAAAERAAAIEAANAAAEAEEQPRAESPDATATTTADSTPNREPQWRPPGGGASYDAAPMDRSRENTRAHPREEGEEIDEENLRPRGASFDEDDDVVAIAGDAAKADADANADGTGDSDETAETSPTDETSDEHDALTCVDEECFEEENLRPRNAVSSDEPWDGEEEEEDDDEWNDAGPGYSSKRPWDDEESHMPPNMRG